MAFTTLTLTSPEAATVTLIGPSSSTITATSTGTDIFYLTEAGTWTIALTNGTESMTTAITAYQSNTAEIAFVHIYGARWVATSDPTWERTNEAQYFTDHVPYVARMTAAQCSSPFDNLYPWCEMTKEERMGGRW